MMRGTARNRERSRRGVRAEHTTTGTGDAATPRINQDDTGNTLPANPGMYLSGNNFPILGKQLPVHQSGDRQHHEKSTPADRLGLNVTTCIFAVDPARATGRFGWVQTPFHVS
jgi:hypothetical protein